MATMEKINFPPLIAEFRNNHSLYNQWYNENEMKYGNLSAQSIASCMVDVVEPIVKATFALNSSPEKLHQVVKSLYLESLNLIGSGLAIRYKEHYQMAWLLMVKMPNLVLKSPTKTISLLHDVLLNLHKYAPEKIREWCKLMELSSSQIKTIEDFKIVGRIYAWKSGLAHLRIRLKADFEALSEDLQHIILENISLDKNTTSIFENPWSNSNTKFEGTHGGFIGTTGFFEHPPKVAQIGEHVFVSDSKNNYALFADQFGTVLIPANTVDATYILSKATRFESIKKRLGRNSQDIDPNTISSVVATKDTLIFTLQNSYFLYLFSLENV